MILDSADSLKNPIHLFAGMVKWMLEAGENFLDYNCHIVPTYPFLTWLSTKCHISSEKANALISFGEGSRYRTNIKEILLSEKLFPTTHGEGGLGMYKAYALLADYACNFKELREEIFEALKSSISHDREGRSIACVINDASLEDIPVDIADLQKEHHADKLNFRQLYTLVSSMSIAECDSFFLCRKFDLPDTLLSVSGPDDLKDPLIAFSVLYNHMLYSSKDFKVVDDELPHVRSFISWLLGKEHINGEIADELLTYLKPLTISNVLKSRILFPKTQGTRNFGFFKSCALLAEFICEFDIFRFAIYDALSPKDDTECKTFLIEKSELTEAPCDIALLQSKEDLSKLSYYQLYHLASSMTISECDNRFSPNA